MNNADYRFYYNWNAAWGYMSFPPSMNINAHDGLDSGLYFVHGRWYNQDTGLWLSSNEVGDYLYGGDGQDPVNIGWRAVDAPPSNPCEINPNSQECDDYSKLQNGGYSKQFGMCLPFGMGCSGGPGTSTLPTQQVGPRLPNMLTIGIGGSGNAGIFHGGVGASLVVDYKHHQIGTFGSYGGGLGLGYGFGVGVSYGVGYCNEACRDISNYTDWFLGYGGSVISPYAVGGGLQKEWSADWFWNPNCRPSWQDPSEQNPIGCGDLKGRPDKIETFTFNILLGTPGAEVHAGDSYAKNVGDFNKAWDYIDVGKDDMAMWAAVFQKVLQFTHDINMATLYADYTFLSPFGQ